MHWAEGRNVFILDNNAMEKESSHKKHSDEQYVASIKHELSHSFFRHVSKAKNVSFPKWLWEGVAIYTSGQLVFKRKPTFFESFLEYYNSGGGKVYEESGFAVELLVNKFGKQKLLDLIKHLKDTENQEQFDGKFYEIYGIQPSYEEFNKLS